MLFVAQGKPMDKPAKTAGAHVQTTWPIIFLLGIVVSFSTALYAQETRDHVLKMGKPEKSVCRDLSWKLP
jgi:hypothetical protein